MSEGNHPRFTFCIEGLEADTFSVIRFKGEEKMSECYRYEIMLASENEMIDFNDAMKPATLSIYGSEGSLMPVNGIVTGFEQIRQFAGLTFYRAILMPRLLWLTMTHKNQIFLEKSLKEIITEILEDGGLSQNDFEFRLDPSFGLLPKLVYVCQFRETHLYFITCLLERAGWYYFFEHKDAGEKLIITDRKISQSPFRDNETLLYEPPSGLSADHADETVQAFLCRQQLIPGNILTKNYNPNKPSLTVEGRSDTQSTLKNRGEIHLYGGHDETPEDAKISATKVSEEYRCRERLYHAETTIPGILPGKSFKLSGHYRDDFNREYLAVELSHEGSQESLLLSGVAEMMGKGEQYPWYRNTVMAIESDLQYRSERKTKPTLFYGTLNAHIDAEGEGEYAELDEQGRYKVILPFDIDKKGSGKASCWLRMMQPYAGPNEGMHFPLRKGTEVLLTFIDGDPDRPVIAGALQNIETPSLVTSNNSYINILRSPTGNQMVMNDHAGQENTRLNSPDGSMVRVGEPDPSEIKEWEESAEKTSEPHPEKGARIKTEHLLAIEAKLCESRAEVCEERYKDEWKVIVGDEHTVDASGKNLAKIHLESKGDAHMCWHGDHIAVVHGHTFETYHGRVEEYFMGTKNEMVLAEVGELSLAGKFELNGGFHAGMFIGGKVEIFMGIKMEVSIAAKFEFGPEEWKYHNSHKVLELEQDQIAVLSSHLKAREHHIEGTKKKVAIATENLSFHLACTNTTNFYNTMSDEAITSFNQLISGYSNEVVQLTQTLAGLESHL